MGEREWESKSGRVRVGGIERERKKDRERESDVGLLQSFLKERFRVRVRVGE